MRWSISRVRVRYSVEIRSILDLVGPHYFPIFLSVTSGNCHNISWLVGSGCKAPQHLARPALRIGAEALGVGHVATVDPHAVQADRAGGEPRRARREAMRP